MTTPSAKDIVHIFLYTKSKKMRNLLHTKKQTLRKKQENFRYVFIYKNQETLRYAIFHEMF